MKHRFRMLFALCLLVLMLSASTFVANANHAWGNYHWARSSNPVSLGLGDNLTGPWSAHLADATADWDVSQVLSLSVVSGQANPRNCRPGDGRIEVCNDTYGFNGWLGIAQIWASGDHITKGAAKMNDSYFNTPDYNTTEWRQMVMCQEVGHVFGLGHQDENFNNSNLGTCMDYTSDPSTNQRPNQHDYQQLEDIYAHLDGGSSGGGGDCNPRSPKCSGNGVPGNVDLNNPNEWGQLIRAEGRTAIYERTLGNARLITFVIWA